MYLSKIWFFLLSLAVAAALVVALVMPRPAERATVVAERQRLATACGVVDILLTDQARQQVGVASVFATGPDLVTALTTASNADTLNEASNQAALKAGKALVESITDRPPDFATLIDKRGRVVARVKLDEKDYGDYASGRPIVDDALAGYVSDDIWVHNRSLYLVRAAPVVHRDPPVDYVGAVVLGYAINSSLASQLASALASPGVEIGFFLGKDTVALSKANSVDNDVLLKAVTSLPGERKTDCAASAIDLKSGTTNLTAVVARLPGEANDKQGYFAVMVEKPTSIGFFGTLRAVDKSDLAPGNFPWVLIGSVFLIALAAGLGFIFLEGDRPLKRLTNDAVKLGKGETDRLAENAHAGKFGSIARAVNIHIDKVNREAKSAKQDLDGLLGPAPEGGLGTIDLLAAALPAAKPTAPPAAPPSEFKFNDPALKIADVAPPPSQPPPSLPPRPQVKPTATAAPVAPPPAPPQHSRPATPVTAPAPKFDEDILGGNDEAEASTVSSNAIDPYFKEVFDQFIALKKQCGEPIAGVTYGKFAEKLERNRAELIGKTGAKEVRFSVYVKDGKAALKASPVRDEA